MSILKTLTAAFLVCGFHVTAHAEGTGSNGDDGGRGEPYAGREFGGSDPYEGTRYDTNKTYPNQAVRSNSVDHAYGAPDKAGEDSYVGQTKVRSLGSDESPSSLSESSSSAPMVFMRRSGGELGAGNDTVVYIYPGHPLWPSGSGNNGSSPWLNNDCQACCNGRSVMANGQCVECPDPSDPPDDIYRCSP